MDTRRWSRLVTIISGLLQTVGIAWLARGTRRPNQLCGASWGSFAFEFYLLGCPGARVMAQKLLCPCPQLFVKGFPFRTDVFVAPQALGPFPSDSSCLTMYVSSLEQPSWKPKRRSFLVSKKDGDSSWRPKKISFLVTKKDLLRGAQEGSPSWLPKKISFLENKKELRPTSAKKRREAFPKVDIHNGGAPSPSSPPAALSRTDEQWVRFLLQSFTLAPLRRRTGLCPVRRRGGAFTEGLRQKSYLLLVGARDSRGR